jgi:hypothetical protein
MRSFLRISIFITLAFLVFRCENQNKEDLFGKQECDSLDVSYSKTIEPILMNNCYECHASSIATAGIILDSYDELILRVNSGRFPGAVNHRDGFTPMPKDRDQLPDCDLAKINNWLNEGAKNN